MRTEQQVMACEAPAGFVTDDTDCDDTDLDAAISPDVTEVCDPEDVDENCNGSADDLDGTVSRASLLE